jgi:hypothetical protein
MKNHCRHGFLGLSLCLFRLFCFPSGTKTYEPDNQATSTGDEQPFLPDNTSPHGSEGHHDASKSVTYLPPDEEHSIPNSAELAAEHLWHRKRNAQTFTASESHPAQSSTIGDLDTSWELPERQLQPLSPDTFDETLNGPPGRLSLSPPRPASPDTRGGEPGPDACRFVPQHSDCAVTDGTISDADSWITDESEGLREFREMLNRMPATLPVPVENGPRILKIPQLKTFPGLPQAKGVRKLAGSKDKRRQSKKKRRDSGPIVQRGFP